MQIRRKQRGHLAVSRATEQVLPPFHRPVGVEMDNASSVAELDSAPNSIYSTLAVLIRRLEQAAALDTGVITWASPVAAFGDHHRARIATVGLNPSNREFVDKTGRELEGAARRFHTLGSLGLESWLDVDARHLQQIAASCASYFSGQPYDLWFKPLDYLASGIGGSFYGPKANACHLDLIPFATRRKWTKLSASQRSKLLSVAADTLALLVRDSAITVLILNGRTVVEQFQSMAGVQLLSESVPEWTLRRRGRAGVAGFGFRGRVATLCDIPLQQEVLILGYNHNLQSSFGVTREVVGALRSWIGRAAEEGV